MAKASIRKRQRRSPARSYLARLSEADRKLYESIPQHVDFVPHPDYERPETEAKLFGPEAEHIPVTVWRQYAESIEPDTPARKRPRLSAAQEATLFMRYNYARYRLAELVAAQQRRFSGRRVEAILLWYKRALENRAALASANMALVVAMARRTKIDTVEFSELVSEGNIALLRALDGFDVRRGFKFSTYACRAFLKAFSRVASKTTTYRRHFPTEFVPEMERSDEADRRYREQRDLAIEDLHRALAPNVARLSRIEREVVKARFAVSGFRRARTLKEVGRLVGLSKERVRQVQTRALAKLRAAMEEVAA